MVATRPLAEVSKSWRDALRKTTKLRRERLAHYKREKAKVHSIVRELQNLFHSNFPEHVESDSDSDTEEGP